MCQCEDFGPPPGYRTPEQMMSLPVTSVPVHDPDTDPAIEVGDPVPTWLMVATYTVLGILAFCALSLVAGGTLWLFSWMLQQR